MNGYFGFTYDEPGSRYYCDGVLRDGSSTGLYQLSDLDLEANPFPFDDWEDELVNRFGQGVVDFYRLLTPEHISSAHDLKRGWFEFSTSEPDGIHLEHIG